MKRRRWFEIHSWLGVVAGLMLFLICWSGTTAVLSYEIDWMLDARMRVEPGPERASWGTLHDSVKQAYPDASGITLYEPPYARSAAHAQITLPGDIERRVYLDPYTGAVQGSTSLFNVQRFFRNLHMCLFDVRNDYGGYWIVGAFSLALLISAVTPLLFYRRWWRGFFTLKTGRGPRVFWSDAHKLAGVWGLAFSFLIALTGLWYLLEWADPIHYPETPQFNDAPLAIHAPQDLDALIERAQQTWPEFQIRTVGTPEGSYWGNVLYLDGQSEALLVRDRSNRMLLDASSGEPRYIQRAETLGWPARWIDTADPLHFGNFGGLISKLVWFGFGLLLSGMCLSGAYLHSQRLKSLGPHRSRIRGSKTANIIWLALISATIVLGLVNFRSYLDDVTTPDESLVAPGVGLFIAAWSLATVLVMWLLFRTPGRPAPDHLQETS